MNQLKKAASNRQDLDNQYAKTVPQIVKYLFKEYSAVWSYDAIMASIDYECMDLMGSLGVQCAFDLIHREYMTFKLHNTPVYLDDVHTTMVGNGSVVFDARRSKISLNNAGGMTKILAQLSELGSDDQVWWFLDTNNECLQEACSSSLWCGLGEVLECTSCNVYYETHTQCTLRLWAKSGDKDVHLDFRCYAPSGVVVHSI